MMLRKTLFALSAVLLLGVTAACGDDDKDKDKDKDNGKDPGVGEKVDPEKYQEFSYVNALSIPEDECCWDYAAGNNDEPEDYVNGVVELLGALGGLIGDFDLDELLGDLFTDGTLTLLLGYEDLPALDANGDVAIDLFLGESDSSWADRNAGNGEFDVASEVIASIKGKLNRRVIEAEADKFPLSLDITGFFDSQEAFEEIGLPEVISIALDGVHLHLDVEENANGVENDITVTEKDGKSINFLSGVISGQTLADVINNLIARDMCGLDQDLLTFRQDFEADPDLEEGELDTPDIDVVPKAKELLETSDNETCADDLAGFIDMVGIVGGLFDVDLDGNNVADGLSLGVNIGITGAIVED